MCVWVWVCVVIKHPSLPSSPLSSLPSILPLTSDDPVVEGGRVLCGRDIHSIAVPEVDPMGGARGAELQVEGV